jgi:SET domain-containing protein
LRQTNRFSRQGGPPLPTEKNLRVKKSGKHGRGIYATAPIPKGVKVIEYVGKLVPVKDSEALAEKQMQRAGKSGTGHVYLFTLNNKYDIDGNVPHNKARLINHSCDPNCEVQIIKGRIWILSKRAIEAGEELTYDYGFNMDYWQDHVCRCGTKKCLGYIVSASRRGALARVLKAAANMRQLPSGQNPVVKRI